MSNNHDIACAVNDENTSVTFKVYPSLTLDSIIEGNIVEGISTNMKADKVKSVIHKWITNEKSFNKVLNDHENFEVYFAKVCSFSFMNV